MWVFQCIILLESVGLDSQNVVQATPCTDTLWGPVKYTDPQKRSHIKKVK